MEEVNTITKLIFLETFFTEWDQKNRLMSPTLRKKAIHFFVLWNYFNNVFPFLAWNCQSPSFNANNHAAWTAGCTSQFPGSAPYCCILEVLGIGLFCYVPPWWIIKTKKMAGSVAPFYRFKLIWIRFVRKLKSEKH